MSTDSDLDLSMSGSPKLLKDSRGYSCSRCRQRFPATIINFQQLKCPSCLRVSSNRIRNPSPGPNSSPIPNPDESYENSTVPPSSTHNFKRKVLHRKYHKHEENNEGSGSRFSSSLNFNHPPWKLESPLSRLDRTPRKRALLIGVTYRERKYRLRGTVNDVKNMRNLLIDRFQFQQQNILVLTEEEMDEDFIPTKKNILLALKWLVKDCQYGDSLVFYFSGHGLRQPDFNRDEKDGFDETICPVDFMQEGMILDNEINSTIVWPLPKGVTLHSIVDACHSGTILDLEYVYDKHKRTWIDNKPPNGSRKHTNGGLAISISACKDDQMAADTTAFTEKEMNGALTYILNKIVKERPGPTYGDLIDMIYETIDQVNKSGSFLSKVLRSMFHAHILQNPLLSASEEFDVYKKHFLL